MTDTLIQTSFANGELSPTIFGREDLPKIHAGAAVMRNFFVDYRGGASTRMGTKNIARTRLGDTYSRLIRFQFSVVQAYILEFGDHYIRVIVDDGLVLEAPKPITGSIGNIVTSAAHGYAVGDWVFFSLNSQTDVVTAVTTNTFEVSRLSGAVPGAVPHAGTVARVYVIPTPWAKADLPLLKYTQSADIMTLTHPDYRPMDLTRFAHNNWTLSPVNFAAWNAGPFIDVVTSTAVGSPGSGDSGTDAYYEYVITVVSQNGEEGNPSALLGKFAYNMGLDDETLNLDWFPVTGGQYYIIYRAAAFNNTKVPAGAVHGYVGQTYGTSFSDTNIIASFLRTPPLHFDPFEPGQVVSATTTQAGTGYSNTPAWTIADPTGVGFYGYLVVSSTGTLSGFVITNPGSGYTAPVMTITDSTGHGATVLLVAGPNTNTYPSSCSYFQQRRLFAGSNNFPESIWGTKPGTITNMDRSNPSVDSDAFQFTLSSNQVNNIKYMVQMPGGLLVFTGSGIWQLSGGGQNTALTPSNAVANPQSYKGCADVPPIPINYSVLFVQEKGAIVAECNYNFYAQIYLTNDVTVLSNHLFYEHSIIDWCYTEEPFKLVWAVRDDGTLLSLTYLKEQELNGWARHDTAGLFESVATIPSLDGKQDMLYFIVRRFLNGVWTRFIEVMQPRNFSLGFDSPWCVDCGFLFIDGEIDGVVGTISAASGNVNFNAIGQFAVGSVGKVLRFGGGRGVVTAFVDANNVVVALDQPVTATLGDGTPLQQSSWYLSDRVTRLAGMDDLEGASVTVVADGLSVGPLIVVGGVVNLATPASLIIVGLPYVAQLQTMYLEGGNQTIQGRRKQIQATTTRVVDTRGLKIGPDFDQLLPLVDNRFGSVNPIGLEQADKRQIMPGGYTEFGQICYQQDQPFPATVTAVIYEVNLGN